MINRQDLVKKWAPILEHESAPKIRDSYRKEVTAVLLENQEIEMRRGREAMGELNEAAPANAVGSYGDTGGFAKFDPVIISLVRRAMPQMIAYDVCGVQPMTQPTGLIFAMKSKYSTQGGTEALFNEADTDFAGTGTHSGAYDFGGSETTGTGLATTDGERLGQGGVGDGSFGAMAFSIEKTSVTAKTRALKAEYSIELAQDMKSVHGLDAEGELSNILSTEILAEINREVIRTVYNTAKPGAQVGTTTAGTFDLDTDSNGRWSVEKFKGLMFQIEREANAIGQQTRRGRGNVIITSADVASALAMAGVLDYSSGLSGKNDLTVDDTSTTFAGVLNGKYKVYVDPYTSNVSATQFFVVGYKGASAFDAGLFYCPYVPLQMVRAVDPNSFQPKIGFKTRYGLVANPFVSLDGTGGLTANENYYYRRVKVTNLM
ncbi:major capsid protein [uncultured Caudovirales phage]|uniref:Major capsid protein n=1 Tax=uncultured Caudovirales phage TaxID=2100421 RepID=A0A6J5PTX2_9CAUD|nr:major capsid protein [uncultured Caudovirales phage]CAB4182001.1 major capsid protein [uncultured Caudovirales phage]CAB4197397.1 major capsid protein [uncultured Caudovirales phage]CAB4211585.1 major capsid protein [uncultured Caudovirales phage]CAB5238698.1 major capsid protein [uncultured Caudovirales phage]